MALMFFTDDYERLYNCSLYNYENKPIEQRAFPGRGWLFLITYLIIWILYFPCILAICERNLLKHSCYKLMLFLAILDLNTGLYTGLWAGIVDVTGIVYCSSPNFMFWVGCFNGMAWKIQSPTCCLLAFNRCVEAFNEKWGNRLFHGWRTYLWMMIPIIWGVRDLLIGPPGIYNLIISSISYNPHAGYLLDINNTYMNKTIFYNNTFCAATIIVTYSIFIILLYIKFRKTSTTSFALQANVFGQVFLIAFMLFIISAGYLLVQYVETSALFKRCLSYTFLLFGGVPALIYLTLNSNIRNKVIKMFKFSCFTFNKTTQEISNVPSSKKINLIVTVM